MYESFYELREAPFDLTPNPRFLLLTPRHREALSNLRYGMSQRKGLTLLLGEAGTGKTTVIHAALAQWRRDGLLVAYLNNPTLTRGEFVEYLAGSFGLPADSGSSKAKFLTALAALALERHKRGLVTGLLVDEAQSLSWELLEEIRLLANIETPSEKIFPVILAGQAELADRLNEPALRQIKQRISLRCTLGPLDAREVSGYIAGRVHIAGGSSERLFTKDAIRAVYDGSRGIPRLINVICDNVLLAGFAANCRPVTPDLVAEVCRDFDYAGAREPLPPPRAATPAPVSAPLSGPLFSHFTAKRRFSFFNF